MLAPACIPNDDSEERYFQGRLRDQGYDEEMAKEFAKDLTEVQTKSVHRLEEQNREYSF